MQPPPIPGTSKNAEIKSIRRIANRISVPIRNTTPLPTYNFLNTLHIFAAALISHHANLKALHKMRAWTMLHSNRNAKRPIQLPAIFARISDLIGTRNKNVKDLIKLSFQGLQVYQPTESELANPTPVNQQPPNNIAPPNRTNENIVMVTEARINIPLPAALKTMSEKIDRDIAFDLNTGSLALRLRSKIGESILPTLIERTVRVFRLIEFVKVLQAHEGALTCEKISLGKITFTYDIYKAVIDFSAPDNKMRLILEQGNPHLEIADFLEQILNGSEGLKGVSTMLPLTLPVLNGLNAIKEAWTSVPSNKGEVFVTSRATDWHLIQYTILPTATDPNSFPRGRREKMEIRLRQRNGVPWWYLTRVRSEGVEDDLDAALKPVWNSSGRDYVGMRVSAVAQAEGVEDLMMKMDGTVRDFAFVQKPVPRQSVILPPQRARPQVMQQRQQMVTPGHSQGSQGRMGNQQNRGVVEID